MRQGTDESAIDPLIPPSWSQLSCLNCAMMVSLVAVAILPWKDQIRLPGWL